MPKLWPEFIGDLQTWQAALGMLPSASGLVVTNNSGTPNSNIDINADYAVLLADTAPGEAIGRTYLAAAVDLTVNTTTTGANGLDTGAKANSTWYHLWIIWGEGQSVAGLASLSATAPTMPADYTHKVRVGANRTDGSGNFWRILQRGNHAQRIMPQSGFDSLISGASGGVAGPAWTEVPVAGVAVPLTARSVILQMWASATGGLSTIAAPNNEYGPPTGVTTSVPPMVLHGGNNFLSITHEMILESANVYYASTQSSAFLKSLGWRDKVNAS